MNKLEESIKDAQNAYSAYRSVVAEQGAKVLPEWHELSPVEQNAWHAVVIAVKGV